MIAKKIIGTNESGNINVVTNKDATVPAIFVANEFYSMKESQLSITMRERTKMRAYKVWS